MGASRRKPAARPTTEPWVTGPAWDDEPELTELALMLRDAHRRVAGYPADTRPRLIRHLLAITDMAKRDPALAARRLATFLADMPETGHIEGG